MRVFFSRNELLEFWGSVVVVVVEYDDDVVVLVVFSFFSYYLFSKLSPLSLSLSLLKYCQLKKTAANSVDHPSRKTR